jgi:hypothetical protein
MPNKIKLGAERRVRRKTLQSAPASNAEPLLHSADCHFTRMLDYAYRQECEARGATALEHRQYPCCDVEPL